MGFSCRTWPALVAALVLLLAAVAEGFYLPGVAPQDYKKGQELFMKVNKLSSVKTQLPYEYYTLPYCKPAKVIHSAENLGEVIRGDRIENSVYALQMREDVQCSVVCRIPALSMKDARAFQEKIDDAYRVNMILDNLPLAMVRMREIKGEQIKTYERGFPVGFTATMDENSAVETYYIYNHLRFNILYHKDPASDLSRIVGFEVDPFSVNHTYEAPWKDTKPQLSTCNPARMTYVTHGLTPQEVATGKEVIFTYDTIYTVSNIRWASRWDTYLYMFDDQIHWFSIVNSLMIVLFLSGMIAMIMLRTLHRDISRYNQLDAEEAAEETGWKLVHGDVFRPPPNASLLAVFVGTGVQISGMSIITLAFAVLGFLSPANRGGLMTAMLLLFVFMGIFAGYASARFLKSFKMTEWKSTTLQTAFLFPGIVFCLFFSMNILIWGKASSGAVPFGTLFAIVFLWFGISVPLVFVGSYLGFKKEIDADPVRTNKIPRQVPEQPWYMKTLFSALVGGVLPFGAVFIELFFILTSVWFHQFYYIFGFLFLVFVILVITCAEITIVLCYFQLCSEDYNWWWRAFLTSGSSAIYLFLYSAFYFMNRLEISDPISTLLYFGYMFIVSLGFFLMTGTFGFISCFAFVRAIYASVKID